CAQGLASDLPAGSWNLCRGRGLRSLSPVPRRPNRGPSYRGGTGDHGGSAGPRDCNGRPAPQPYRRTGAVLNESRLDAADFAIVWSRLVAISDEMWMTIRRTAF